MAMSIDDNAAGGNLDKRNIRLIKVNDTGTEYRIGYVITRQ